MTFRNNTGSTISQTLPLPFIYFYVVTGIKNNAKMLHSDFEKLKKKLLKLETIIIFTWYLYIIQTV